MKKGWKRFFLVCAIVFGIGVVCSVSGLIVGFSNEEVRTAFLNGWNRIGIHHSHAYHEYEVNTEMSVEEVTTPCEKEMEE